MGFVNLKEMAKMAKMKEEEVMDLVEIGVIKPQKSYCHPGNFGDGREIAFVPENALADIKAAKTAPKVEPEPEPEPEEPEEEEETVEAPVPEEPKDDKGEGKPKGKEKKTGKK